MATLTPQMAKKYTYLAKEMEIKSNGTYSAIEEFLYWLDENGLKVRTIQGGSDMTATDDQKRNLILRSFGASSNLVDSEREELLCEILNGLIRDQEQAKAPE